MNMIKDGTRGLKRIIVFSLIFILLLGGCGKKNDDSQDQSSSSNQVPSNTQGQIDPDTQINQQVPIYDSDITKLLEDENISEDYKLLLSGPEDYEPLEDTSYDKLHDAFDKNEITEEEYSKLLILLKYRPELVPVKYSGAQGCESIDHAYQFISDNRGNLSEDTKKLIEPYMLPIDNPGSYYFYTDEEEEPVSEDSSFGLSNKVYAAGVSKQLVVNEFYVDDQKVTIQYYEYEHWNQDKKLEYNMCVNDIEEAVIHSYNEFENLLTVSLTKPVLIEVVQLQNFTNGEAWFENGQYRIRLSKSLYQDAVKIKGVTAHELFHNFQYEMGLRFTGKDMKWLHEATAKWSEHYAFDSYNTEHGYLNYFFRTLDRDRINFGDNFEYSGYMLFYYFSDYGQYNIVPDILWGTVRNGASHIREYLTNMVEDMRDQYGDYAFINLNSGISLVYDDHGPLSGFPSGKAYARKIMKVNEENIREVSLDPGALQYYFYMFDKDAETEHIEFRFDETFDKDKYIKRQAIIKVNGEWHLEDWSSKDEIKYCRQNEPVDENVQAVLLIYSNSNFKRDGANDSADHFKVTTGKCYSEMRISIRAEYVYTNENFIWTSNASLHDTVKIIDHSLFISRDCVYEMEGTGVLEGNTVIETACSNRSAVANPDIENSLARLILPFEDDSGEMENQLKEYGITQNTPAGGILITLPSLREDEELTGSTNLYMPDPIGKMPMDMPLPYDGISQVIAVEIGKNDWSPQGFNTSMTINIFSHEPPILDWFEVDPGQLREILSSMNADAGIDIPDFDGLWEDSGLDPEGIGDIDGLIPENDPNSGSDPLSGTIDALMMLAEQSPDNGASAVVKLTIRGEYVED